MWGAFWEGGRSLHVGSFLGGKGVLMWELSGREGVLMWGAFWEGRSLNVRSFLGGKESSCGELSGREGVFMWELSGREGVLMWRAFWEGLCSYKGKREEALFTWLFFLPHVEYLPTTVCTSLCTSFPQCPGRLLCGLATYMYLFV